MDKKSNVYRLSVFGNAPDRCGLGDDRGQRVCEYRRSVTETILYEILPHTRHYLERPRPRGAAALSKHLALPCAKCLRARGVFLVTTVLRRGFATMTLRLSLYPAIGGFLPSLCLPWLGGCCYICYTSVVFYT